MLQKLKKILDRVALVSAALLDPETVTACNASGANYGYLLLWALLFRHAWPPLFYRKSARLGLVYSAEV